MKVRRIRRRSLVTSGTWRHGLGGGWRNERIANKVRENAFVGTCLGFLGCLPLGGRSRHNEK
jgi:hypothetical protein